MTGLTNHPLVRIFSWISELLEYRLKPIFEFLIYLRVPFIIAILSFLIFAQVDQTIEVYRATAQDSGYFEAIAATIFAGILSLAVWYSARLLELNIPELEKILGKPLLSPPQAPLPFLHKISHLNQIIGLIGFGFLVAGVVAALQGVLLNLGLIWLISCLLFFICLPDRLNTWVPRILGIIPLVSLSYGIATALQASSQPFLWGWLISSQVLAIAIFYGYVERTEGAGAILGSNEPGVGLFGARFENIFIVLISIVFSAFSLPLIVAAQPSPVCWGVVCVFILLVLLNGLLLSWRKRPQERQEIWVGFTLALVGAVLILWLLPPTFVPGWLGSLSVVALSLTILVIVVTTIYNWGYENKIPAVTGLIVLAILSSFFNWNDNHRLRPLAAPRLEKLPTLEAGMFKDWLASRPDRAAFKDKPYPVYIAAAQGGGIYAAYHAATTFAKLTDAIPCFPEHVFAISGVSGGSLGSTAYASLVKANYVTQNRCTQPALPAGSADSPLFQQAKAMFDQDFLSPLLTMGLFPDLVQRFIPFPAIYDWDRAVGLEVAFETAWDKLFGVARNNPLQRSFYEHWEVKGNAPALVLNSTIVETGERLVFSPFLIPTTSRERLVLNEPTLNFRLSTVAGASARFPLVTPVGWYHRSSNGDKLRLADGGYFDNSGVPTALDIGRNLQKIPGYGTEFKVIYLSLVDQLTQDPDAPIVSGRLNEIASPISAIFNAREARSRNAVQLSTFTVNDDTNNPLQNPMEFKFRTIYLLKSSKKERLPLGWLLSSTSQDLIDRQLDMTQACKILAFESSYRTGKIGADVYNHNRCVAQTIQNDFNPSAT
jgi:hypothetical protein